MCNGKMFTILHFSKRLEWIRTGGYVFTEALNNVSKTLKVRLAVKEPFRVLGWDQYTAVILCRKLVERPTADRIARAPWPAGVPVILAESASEMELWNKNLEVAY